MLFTVFFEDDPDADPAIRGRDMQAHLAFLQKHSERIEAAGPLLTSEGAAAGGLWLVNARDDNSVRALVEEDPFWSTGLRKSVRILAWNQVFAQNARVGRPAPD